LLPLALAAGAALWLQEVNIAVIIKAAQIVYARFIFNAPVVSRYETGPEPDGLDRCHRFRVA